MDGTRIDWMFVLPILQKVSDQELENNLVGNCHGRSPPTCNRPLPDSANSICHRNILTFAKKNKVSLAKKHFDVVKYYQQNYPFEMHQHISLRTC